MSDLERRLEDLFMSDSRARRVERVNVAQRAPRPFAALAFVGGVAAVTLAVIVTLSLLRGGQQVPASSPSPDTSAAAVVSASPSASSTLGEQVMCGQISQFKAPTSTDAGSFVITPRGQSGNFVVIRASARGDQGTFTGYQCVRVNVTAAAPSVVLVSVLSPGTEGYVPEGAAASSAPSATPSSGAKPDTQHGIVTRGGAGGVLRTEGSPTALVQFGDYRSLATTKDGKRVAYVRVTATSQQLVVFDTAKPDAQKSVIDLRGDTETLGGVVWSSDSNDEVLVEVDKRDPAQPIGVVASSLRAVNVDTGASREVVARASVQLLPIAWRGRTSTGAAVETGDGGFATSYDYISAGNLKRSPLGQQIGAFSIRADGDGNRILALGPFGTARGVSWWPIDRFEERRALDPAEGWDVSVAYWRAGTDEIVVFASPTVKGAPGPAPRIEAWSTGGQRRTVAEAAGPLAMLRVDGTAAITTNWNLVDLMTGAVTQIPRADNDTPAYAVRF